MSSGSAETLTVEESDDEVVVILGLDDHSQSRADRLRNAKRCGARNRRGFACQCIAMANGRCRLHGGLSTGPRTKAGMDRIRLAHLRHGQRCQSLRAMKRAEREFFRVGFEFVEWCRVHGRHGLLPPLLAARINLACSAAQSAMDWHRADEQLLLDSLPFR